MNLFQKAFQILVPKERPPSWRPRQPMLDVFKSLHPKNHIDPTKSVESQFSPEEVRRIHAAAHFTRLTHGDIGGKDQEL